MSVLHAVFHNFPHHCLALFTGVNTVEAGQEQVARLITFATAIGHIKLQNERNEIKYTYLRLVKI